MLFNRFALVLALVVSLSVGSVAAQIPGIPGPSGIAGEYRSDVTGNVIGWTPDWMLGTSDVQEILRYDQTTLFSPLDQAIVDILLTAQDLEAGSMRDEMIANFSEGDARVQIVDSGDYGDIAYALGILETGADVFGAFVLVNTSRTGGTGITLIAPINSFGRGVEKAQSTLTIDYVPVLSGTDGSALQKQLEAAPRVEVDSTPMAPAQTTDDASFTSKEWGYTVGYPEDWEVVDAEGDGELEISNPAGTATLGFMALENPGSDQAGLEAELESSFKDSIEPFGGTLISLSSAADRAILVVDMDGMILVQEMVIFSPDVIVVVTAFISGDLDSVLDDIQEVTLNETGIFPMLGENEKS